ncbi:MAG: TRAP transporter small permease subunit [bacterium]|jgi:TRAP-type C4-dicarboxylate transport system permease small subunit
MKGLYQSLVTIQRRINIALSEICGLLLFIVMVLLTLDVVFRATRPIPGLTTLGVLVYLAVVYLGLSRSEELGEHTAIDMFTGRLPLTWKKAVNIVVGILKVIAVGLLLWVSLKSLTTSYLTQESFADVVKIPIWPSKLAAAIGSFFFLTQVVLSFWAICLGSTEGDTNKT